MTIKELKQAAEQLATVRGISTQQAADIIRNGELPAETPKDSRKTKKQKCKENIATGNSNGIVKAGSVIFNRVSKEIAQDIQNGNAPTIDIIETDLTPELLPVGLHDDIAAIIQGFSDSHDIKDKYKIDPRQFSAICMQVGTMIKQRGILRDREREKIEGGIRYSPDKVGELLRLYAYLCNEYRQIAFTFNFRYFAGVSEEYLRDYEGRLTSTRGGIAKKCSDLQRESITASIASNSGNVVGNIFLGKALAGLQETVTVQHVTTAAAPASASLPVFDTVAGGLIEQNGE